jgi:RimJ/RimL family protein N-acetyltransferase
MPFSGLDSISTARLQGERMTIHHFSEVQRMHQDKRFMAYLGGLRSDDVTADYLNRNIAHWDKHGFGIWIIRDSETSDVIGRGGLRHVDTPTWILLSEQT